MRKGLARLRRSRNRLLRRGRCPCGARGPLECPHDYPGDCDTSWLTAEQWAMVQALPRQPLPGTAHPLPMCYCTTNQQSACPIHGIGNGPIGQSFTLAPTSEQQP